MTAVVVRRNNRENDTIEQMRGIVSRMIGKMMKKISTKQNKKRTMNSTRNSPILKRI